MHRIPRERERRLIIFTRYPEPGRVKIRLVPALGGRGAATLHHWMAVRTLFQARRLLREASSRAVLEVRYEGGSARCMRQWLGRDLQYRSQGPGDLGERLARATREGFAGGAQQIILIGTDCPGLSAHRLKEAFEALEEQDLVLGPARDGGYYLIGLRRLPDEKGTRLFSGISWGTGAVLQQTIEAVASAGLTFTTLEPLDDVDRPEDLVLLQDRSKGILPPGWISIVIPARNERDHIGKVLASTEKASNLEIIVVDGRSEDGTPEIARSRGATVLSTPPGRALQMNAGAERATGDILLFLHADTALPSVFDGQIRAALAEPEVVGGAFRLRLDAPHIGLRIIEGLANWRSRTLKLPYGDQGIFLRADVFWELGGFPDMPIMEDFELARQLGRRGRIRILLGEVRTSARRWLGLGLWRTTLINQAVIIGYLLGVSPARLARWYRGVKRRSPRA